MINFYSYLILLFDSKNIIKSLNLYKHNIRKCQNNFTFQMASSDIILNNLSIITIKDTDDLLINVYK